MLFESIFLDIIQHLPSQKLLREKKIVREVLAQKRRLLTKDEVQRQSELLLSHLEQLPVFQQAKVVLIYYPTHNEVDLLPLIKRYKKEKTFLLPVVHRRYMAACPYEGNDKMHRGRFRIPEPTTNPYTGHIDMILLPGVAFDKAGNRLGRGGGFYDRFLAKSSKDTVLVGVGYDFQLEDEIPAGRRDKRMHYIITPSHGVLQAKRD